MKRILVVFLFFIPVLSSLAQLPGGRTLQGIKGGLSGINSGGAGGDKKDSTGLGFEHRDDAKDSVTLTYKYLDSVRTNTLDSSINDFYKYFSVPAALQYLGNNGSAGYSLIYSPFMKAGWDAGFHAFDAYRFTLEESKFYKTSKPFTQLNYQLASGKEQMIRAFHTQNPKSNLNFGFDYRLISAPGFFITQNTNHNNYRVFSSYQGKRKRYAAYLSIVGNAIKSSENGGVQNDSFILAKNFSKRFTVPVNLGGEQLFQPNPFKSSVNTGNIYKDFTFFLRQSYDIGKKDSIIVNDSTTDYLFYPKLRFQYSFTYSTYSYNFKDEVADSAIYQNWYDITLRKSVDSLNFIDKWKVVSNDLSLIQFPDTKNQAQFLLAGIKLENIQGTFLNSVNSYHNIILHGEYRNKTRNKQWDILARGELYLNGYNSGDYNIYGTLARFFPRKWGNVRLTFNNVNRSPSAIYTGVSSFNLGNTALYNKENITMLKAVADNPFITLSVTNYLITNFIYFKNYYQTQQYSKPINLLQLSASKKIKLTKRFNWYADVVLQKTDDAAPVKVPLLFTRNRLAYEARQFKNLNLSAGIEFRYYTAYDAYNYSPVMGQFTVQDTFKLKNRPDISAYVHFRIKSFTAFLRGENLNAVNFANGFEFTNNNYAAPHYVYPGFIFRVGIRWWFVN